MSFASNYFSKQTYYIVPNCCLFALVFVCVCVCACVRVCVSVCECVNVCARARAF